MSCRFCKFVLWLMVTSTALSVVNYVGVPVIEQVDGTGATRMLIVASMNCFTLLLFVCFKPEMSDPLIRLQLADGRENGPPLIVAPSKRSKSLRSKFGNCMTSFWRRCILCKGYSTVDNDTVEIALQELVLVGQFHAEIRPVIYILNQFRKKKKYKKPKKLKNTFYTKIDDQWLLLCGQLMLCLM